LPLIRLHDLRHTHATMALRAGVHPKVVSERLGHATVTITLDLYSHASETLQSEAAGRVADLVFGLAEPHAPPLGSDSKYAIINKMTIAESIRAARVAQRLSQRRLARAAGVPQSTVGRLETGVLHPRVDTVEKLLDALDHDVVLRRRLGRGVDRSLIQGMLTKSPRERLLYAASAGEAIKRLQRGAHAAR
jgi:transcriptional regulator with XRE-family HTH domain